MQKGPQQRMNFFNWRLCWKLPDLRECSEWHAYHDVNDRPQPSEMKHSPLPGQHPCYPYQDTRSQVSQMCLSSPLSHQVRELHNAVV